MRLNRYVPALLALALPLAACGADDKPIQRVGQQSATTAETAPISAPSTSEVTTAPEPTPQVTTTEAPPTTEPPVAVPRPVRTVPPTTSAPRTTVAATSAGGLACGGSMPPCSVMQRESGGNATIYNTQGSGASGKWQFMPGTWDGYGGYANAADAPVSVQDAKAREVWAGGAGCGHWDAC